MPGRVFCLGELRLQSSKRHLMLMMLLVVVVLYRAQRLLRCLQLSPARLHSFLQVALILRTEGQFMGAAQVIAATITRALVAALSIVMSACSKIDPDDAMQGMVQGALQRELALM
jgi:hypothetical protein